MLFIEHLYASPQHSSGPSLSGRQPPANFVQRSKGRAVSRRDQSQPHVHSRGKTSTSRALSVSFMNNRNQVYLLRLPVEQEHYGRGLPEESFGGWKQSSFDWVWVGNSKRRMTVWTRRGLRNSFWSLVLAPVGSLILLILCNTST